MSVKAFWLEPTEQMRVWLRRFRSSAITAADGSVVQREKCPLPWGYHDKSELLVDALPYVDDDQYLKPSEEDPRWPTHCNCGYAFQAEDPFQLFRSRLYAGAPDGKLYSLQDAPIGAMWDAAWFRSEGHGEPWTGPDGISLHVKTPGGDWCVDSEASNCTRTQWGPKEIDGRVHEKVWLGRTHFCWVRHGDPRNPATLHVDKNGNTCAAGAGSIQCGKYHGFLHHGELT